MAAPDRRRPLIDHGAVDERIVTERLPDARYDGLHPMQVQLHPRIKTEERTRRRIVHKGDVVHTVPLVRHAYRKEAVRFLTERRFLGGHHTQQRLAGP